MPEKRRKFDAEFREGRCGWSGRLGSHRVDRS
jgi:hypothetical protein